SRAFFRNIVHQYSDGEQGNAYAHGRASSEDRHGKRQPTLWEHVRDQRIGGRIQRRLSRPHTEASGRKLPEVACEPTGGGGQAPEYDSGKDQSATVVSIGRPSQSEAEGCIENRKGEPVQQSYLKITDRQIGAN